MTKTKVTFKQFHNAYGKAYGAEIDRIAAERAWKRLTDHDRRAAIAGITAYRDYCQGKGVAMAYPSKYLNLHRWEIKVAESPVSGFKFQDSGSAPHLSSPANRGCGVSQGVSGTKTEHSDALANMDEW